MKVEIEAKQIGTLLKLLKLSEIKISECNTWETYSHNRNLLQRYIELLQKIVDNIDNVSK